MEKEPAETESSRLLILGASARAAATSAVRAGFQPVCGDLFADVDLREIAPVERVTDYPRGLVAVAEKTPPGNWMYVGAVENHPNVVAEISARHRLLGNGPDVLRAVRDPVRVTEFLRANGFPVLAVRTGNNPPTAGDWLRKPLKSAAGRGIRIEKPGSSVRSPEPQASKSPAHYFQKLGTGKPISATFVANARQAELVGVTRQLIGIPEWNAPAFAYCGSIGPLASALVDSATIERMGNAIAREFQLRGLFGFDLLSDGGDVWLLEVNPRYSASVEVLERATGRSLIAEHAAACGLTGIPTTALIQSPSTEGRFVGKAIVFASRETTVGPFPARTLGDHFPAVADRPAAGSVIRPGEPICTVFAEGETVDGCHRELDARALEALRHVSG